MKTTFFTLILVMMGVSTAIAQTEKGRWTVGVSIGNFTYQDNNTSKTFTGSLAPSAGYFVANNLLVGTGLPLSLSTSKPGQSNPFLVKSTTTGIGLSPFIRYYFGKSALKPYVGVSYSYAYMHYAYKVLPIFGNDASTNGYATSLVPTLGVAYFINRNIALNTGLNYNILNSKIGYYTPVSSVSPRVGTIEFDLKSLSLSIGFQIFLGK